MKPHPSDLLVLAGEDDLAAIPVEGGGQDELGQGEVDEALASADVPHADVVVAAAGEEDVLGGGVPHHDPHSPLVEVQVHNAAAGEQRVKHILWNDGTPDVSVRSNIHLTRSWFG